MPVYWEKGAEMHLDYSWTVSVSASLAGMIPVMLWLHENIQADEFLEL